MTASRKVVILPHYGEFGWAVMHHVRFFHQYQAARKVVCIERGMECLYPTADDFFYEWRNPCKDEDKCGWTSMTLDGLCRESDAQLRQALPPVYPGHGIVRPTYDCPWHWSDLIKFKPVAPAVLPAADVALGVRRRRFVDVKNWGHWRMLASALRAAGLKVGLVGDRDTSFADIPADVAAWEHPGGATAGTVDLLSRCGLYVGSDTGVSHLAALMDTPMLVFRRGAVPGNDDLTGIMERANQRYYRRLPDRSWGNPDEVLGASLRCFAEASNLPVRRYYSQHGEDRWIVENVALPKAGVFVDVGAGDPKELSNTYAFERAGWSGVLVEADPRRHEALRRERTTRLFTCAIAGQDGRAEFGAEPSPDLSGLLRHSDRRIDVETRTLESVLREATVERIDLLSIDTEGTELDVWRSFDVPKHRPRVVVMEWETAGLPDRRHEIIPAVTASGYRLIHTTPGNLIFEPTAP